MKTYKRITAAIIAEYNPFHTGHKYHIGQTRALGATHIVAIMSGAAVQRGEAALFDKHFRARQAVLGGADLVVELPCPFSCSCAEIFAKAAVSIIERMGCVDMLSFGAESDTETLKSCAEASEAVSGGLVREFLKEKDYPTAFRLAVEKHFGERTAEVFDKPNNLLAIEYIKALSATGSAIKPVAVHRAGAAHDSGAPDGGFASGLYIRNGILRREDMSSYLGYDFDRSAVCDTNRLSDAIMLRLMQITDSGEWDEVPDFSAALADRLKKALASSKYSDFSSLIDNVKSKSFTRARVSRALFSAFLGIRHDDLTMLPYCRVLAFNERGREIMRDIKLEGGIEISTSLSDFSQKRLAFLDDLSSRVCSCCRIGGPSAQSEYRRKFSGFIHDQEQSP